MVAHVDAVAEGKVEIVDGDYTGLLVLTLMMVFMLVLGMCIMKRWKDQQFAEFQVKLQTVLDTVYKSQPQLIVTKTGECYHYNGDCVGLKNAGADSKRNLRPCAYCVRSLSKAD
jgi:hypothetical protein